jgi:hypothetical protein
MHRQAGWRLVLIAGSVLALVAVGLAWKLLRVEWLFIGWRGWWAWAAILLAAAFVGRRRGPAGGGDGLGARLGRARGRLPSAVFLGLAAVFAVDAVAVADAALAVAAAGAIAALAWITGRASSGS